VKIAKGMAVRLHITLATTDGQMIESSDKTGPVDYVHGSGAMLAGVEKALEGLEVGASREGVIPAQEAFGVESSMPTKHMPRAEFGGAKLEVGQGFEAKGPDGKPVQFKVVEIGDKEVTVRFLHPLTGKDIKFTAKVLGVKDPAKSLPPPPPAEALDLGSEIKEEK
jgi:FKBP-type peptidyl-prolyl cis-trans isomerase 2